MCDVQAVTDGAKTAMMKKLLQRVDLMTWKRNTHGKLQPAVYDATGKRIAGGCPGMNPWRE